MLLLNVDSLLLLPHSNNNNCRAKTVHGAEQEHQVTHKMETCVTIEHLNRMCQSAC